MKKKNLEEITNLIQTTISRPNFEIFNGQMNNKVNPHLKITFRIT